MARYKPVMPDRILADTAYLRLVDRDGWYFVERRAGTGVVSIVALTEGGEILFVEQERKALQRAVIELPAGLVGDEADRRSEAALEAAQRELLEETGYEATDWERILDCASSPGISDEIVTFFLARSARRVSDGGGTGAERIVVHAVAWADVDRWLAGRAAAGTPVAAKVYAGLYFASKRLAGG